MSPSTLSIRTASARSTTPRIRAGSAGSISQECSRTKRCSSSVSTRHGTDARGSRPIQDSPTHMRQGKRRRGKASKYGRYCALPDFSSDVEEIDDERAARELSLRERRLHSLHGEERGRLRAAQVFLLDVPEAWRKLHLRSGGVLGVAVP